MRLTADELARIEAMMEQGRVSSEPAVLSRTDSMLDALLARARGAPPPAAPARPRPPAASSRYTDWLNLPSLEELLDARRALLRP